MAGHIGFSELHFVWRRATAPGDVRDDVAEKGTIPGVLRSRATNTQDPRLMEEVDLKICADCGIAPDADCADSLKHAAEKGDATPMDMVGFDPELRIPAR